MSERFFITGSGTGVGKTLVAATLGYQLRKAGKSMSVLKPVISGYDEQDMGSDTAMLLQSLGQPVNKFTVESISPWRFKAPLAPNVAARREGRDIALPDLLDFCNMPRTSETVLIEGAGGVMAPLTNEHTILDWMDALACPAIVVVGTYLGAISHALTAGEVLKARRIPVQALIVSESEAGAMSALDTASELKQFFCEAKHIVPLPRIGGAKERLWEHAADLTWILT